MSHLTPLSLPLHPLTGVNNICLQAVVAITASHSASHLLWIQRWSPRGSTLGHLGTGLAGMMKGCLGVALPLLQPARIAPHQEKEGRKVSLHPWGLRKAIDGGPGGSGAGPRCAVPKPGPIPKFPLPSLVMSFLSYPSFTLRLADPPRPSSTLRGPCPWERHFKVESGPSLPPQPLVE